MGTTGSGVAAAPADGPAPVLAAPPPELLREPPPPPPEKTSEKNFGYLTATPTQGDFDPSTESMDDSLKRLYDKIKNPDPGDDEETISARRRMFAQMRAAQMRSQMNRGQSSW